MGDHYRDSRNDDPRDLQIHKLSAELATLRADLAHQKRLTEAAREALAIWERTPFPHLVNLLADDETKNCAAVDFDRKRGDETERWILTAQKAEGKTPLDRVVELEKALATLRADLARVTGERDALATQLREAEEACLEAQDERDRLSEKYEPAEGPAKYS